MPITLAELAERSGLAAADVAFLAQLEESTVSRLWTAADWLDRVKGKTLQSLVAVLPGVAEHLVRDTLNRRRRQLVAELEENRLHVDQEAFRRMVVAEGVPEQILANALDAALCIMSGNPQETARYLARFWGRMLDTTLSSLWVAPELGGVFADPGPLFEAAEALAIKLVGNAHSYHAMLGHATLAHHVAKATGRLLYVPNGDKMSRQMVMSYRSTLIGQLIQTGDLDVAERYGRMAHKSTLLGMVERWSFPTYNRDAAVTTDFSLPGSILLRNTSRQLLSDLGTENEAYFFYLAGTAVPFMLRCDPTLGLKAPQVRARIVERMETHTAPVTRDASAVLLRSLPVSV
jgi:hypothetical protein